MLSDNSVYVAYSRSLRQLAVGYAYRLRREGREVTLPIRDVDAKGELQIFSENLPLIEQRGELHVLSDGTSQGLWLEVGAALALRKKIVVVKLDRPAGFGLLEEIQANEDRH